MSGLSSEDYQNKLREFAFNVLAKPLIFVLAIIIIGAILESGLKIVGSNNQFIVGVSLIPFLIEYYFYVKKRMLEDIKK